jgi:hypothetical protein
MGGKHGKHGGKHGGEHGGKHGDTPFQCGYQGAALWSDRPAASCDAGKENAESHYRRSSERLTKATAAEKIS